MAQACSIDLGREVGYWRSLALLLGVLLLACLLMLAWQRRQHGLLESRLKTARRDIELREAAEEAQRLTQFCLDHSTVGILWLNWDSRVRYANQAAELLLGHSSGGLLDLPLETFDPALGMDAWLARWRAARTGEDDRQVHECEWQRADGQRFPAAVTYSFLRFGSREYLVVFRRHHRAPPRQRPTAGERGAPEGHGGQRAGLGVSPGARRPQAPVRVAYISEASQRLVGYSAERLLQPGQGIRSLVHADDEAGYWPASSWRWRKARTGDGRGAFSIAMATCAGPISALPCVASRMAARCGRYRLGHHREQAHRAGAGCLARAIALAAHLETVREEEKAHIAREVHDELGQVLTVLKLETRCASWASPSSIRRWRSAWTA